MCSSQNLLKGGTGVRRHWDSPGTVKSEDLLFISNQLRKLRQYGKWIMKTFSILETNTTMRNVFKIFKKFVVCSNFIGVMSNQLNLVLMLQTIKKTNLRKLYCCHKSSISYGDPVLRLVPSDKFFVKGTGSFLGSVNE